MPTSARENDQFVGQACDGRGLTESRHNKLSLVESVSIRAKLGSRGGVLTVHSMNVLLGAYPCQSAVAAQGKTGMCRRPRFGCRLGIFSPSCRQIRSTRLRFTQWPQCKDHGALNRYNVGLLSSIWRSIWSTWCTITKLSASMNSPFGSAPTRQSTNSRFRV